MVRLNKSEFKWFIILILLTLYIFKLIFTGDISFFIHPRMIKYVKISLIVLLFLTIFQIKRLFIAEKKVSRKIYFSVFLIPLFLGFFINPQGLSGEVAGKKGVNLLQAKNNSEINNSKSLSTSSNNTAVSNTNTSSLNNEVKNTNIKVSIPKAPQKTDSNSIKDTSKLKKDDILAIDTKNFTHITDEMCYGDLNKYIGKHISITGFVYRDESTTKNEFILSRLMLVCCTADAEVVGLLSDWSNASTLKSDQWVKVTGKVDSEKHLFDGENQLIPVIRVEKVESIEKPKEQYVYPE